MYFIFILFVRAVLYPARGGGTKTVTNFVLLVISYVYRERLPVQRK